MSNVSLPARAIQTVLLASMALTAACDATQPAPTPATPATGGAPAGPGTFRALPLPGAPPEGVFMDLIVCDHATGRVWVAAGNTGSVDVIEPGGSEIKRVVGFPTAVVEREGKKRTVGPSSAAVGDGVAYAGNRADSTVCAIDAKTLVRGACVTLESSPDGLAYVAATKELWVTTPHDKSITILDASTPATLKAKGKIAFEGEPEGYAVDEKRGVFYTNLEDKDRTLAVDVRTRKITATWRPQCGEEGPRGLIVDAPSNFVVVACTDHLVVLDAGHDGKLLSRLDTGAGVDNLDYLDARHEVYAAAGKAAKLTVARLEASGALTTLSVTATAPGARNAVVDANGNAYVIDSKGGRILMVPAPAGK
jgi:DNA-binding beta-propeller fold protein YncE